MVKASNKGFTLIELMIVVAIIGIIAALAYPSYMESVRRANRAEAKSSLADAAHRLQRCYTTYAQFDNASCAVYNELSGPGITTPGRGFYSVTIGGVTPRAYTLTATAVLSPQTGDTNEGCNIMTLNQLGVREPEACW